MIFNRRSVIAGAAFLLLRPPAGGAQSNRERIDATALRGRLDAGSAGLSAKAGASQGPTLQRLIARAVAEGLELHLPPGRYRASGLTLPDGASLSGMPGKSVLIADGPGPVLAARHIGSVRITGITVEGTDAGAGGRGDGNGDALLNFDGVGSVMLTDMALSGGGGHGIALSGCGGRIAQCRISGAAGAGLYALDSRALEVSENSVTDCGNGGVLVHRSKAGPDGSRIAGNRIERIAARAGGTGQNGNGINLFRADGVEVSGNRIAACAFSAIRANAASDIIIRGNHCLGSGETAIYAEFGFSGAVIGDNLIDGAANGILVVNLDAGGRLATVSGNLLRNLTAPGPYRHEGQGFGMGIAVEADSVVSGNVIENAAKWGLLIGWGPYQRGIVASGNLIRRAPVGIAVSVAEGAGAVLISGNLIAETPEGAIRGYRWNEAATGDLIGGAGPGLPHLSIVGNRAD